MSKVSVLAPLEDREKLIDRLHELGAVQIIDVDLETDADGEGDVYFASLDPETWELRLALAKTDFIIEIMQRF